MQTEAKKCSIDSRLRDGTDIMNLVDERRAHISRRVYVDPEIFEIEQDRLFGRSWQFLCHETELPQKGDFVTRELAGEPVVIVRGDDGVIRAFLNSCRHRGMRLCRADKGRMSFMRCSYHGWSYAKTGALINVFAKDLYAAENLRKEQLGLIAVAKLESYRGLVFGTWNKDIVDLKSYLGNMAFYLDLFLGRTDGGTEIVGSPQVWEAEANWKFATDNFTGDNFHLYNGHGSIVQLGLVPPDPMSLSHGYLIRAEGGHVLHVVPGAPDPMFEYFGLPKELVPHLKRNLNPAQLSIAKQYAYSVGTVFPNLSFMQVMIQGDPATPPTPFLSIRFWQPLGPTKLRIWSYLLLEKEAPPAYRKASYETYVRTFGPSGIFEQDDVETWEECTRVNKGRVAQQYGLHHGMNRHVERDMNFPGPGEAWPGSYGERTQVLFYGEWQRWLTEQTPWVRP